MPGRVLQPPVVDVAARRLQNPTTLGDSIHSHGSHLVDELQEFGPLWLGDQLTVLGIEDVDEHCGVLVACCGGGLHCSAV